MKNTKIIAKLAALVLVLCMGVSMFAACGSNDTVISMTVDGKTYEITEEEFSLILKVRKFNIWSSMMLPSSLDTPQTWAEKMTDGDGITLEEHYMGIVMDSAKAILVEKYLFDKYQLTIPEETLETNKRLEKNAIKTIGGKGAYKHDLGYTASDYYGIYAMMEARSEAVKDFLCSENGELSVTDADLAKYYTDNYAGYQCIFLDMNNKVVLDDEGNRVRQTTKTKDENGNEIEVEAESYKTEALTDEEKSEKQNLPAKILAELEEGTKTFEELVLEYSDDYISIEFAEGFFSPKGSAFNNDTINSAIEDLEIGEYTEKAISVSSNAYQYIIKRVDLKEGAYNDEKYAKFFDGTYYTFEETVTIDKYENHVKTYFDQTVVDQAVAGRYTVADTTLSKRFGYFESDMDFISYDTYVQFYYSSGYGS